MLPGTVSPTRPLLMISMLTFDLSRDSSRRITSGYVAADVSTHRPTVEDEPIATILTGSPDFRRAAVRGNTAPNDRASLAARHLSAAGTPPQARESIQSAAPASTSVPTNAIPAIRDLPVGDLLRAWFRRRRPKKPDPGPPGGLLLTTIGPSSSVLPDSAPTTHRVTCCIW